MQISEFTVQICTVQDSDSRFLHGPYETHPKIFYSV